MLARDWQTIINTKLNNVATVREICSECKCLYDQSYKVLRMLVESNNVRYWSEMKEVFKNINGGIIKDFEERYKNSRSG